MLSAILNGKARSVPDYLRPGDSWRNVFRMTEDLLTATVLEGLCYLEGRIFWHVLQRSLMPNILPIRTVAELDEFTLWPRWNAAVEQLGQDVELMRYFVSTLVTPPTK
jgi:hypothetical protein